MECYDELKRIPYTANTKEKITNKIKSILLLKVYNTNFR